MSTTNGNFTDGPSTGAFITATSSTVVGRRITPGIIVLCTFLFVVVVISTVANLFVLLSYKFEKKLRTKFAILIGNLAITDFLVSCFPMFCFTINILFNYWPLGRVLCGVWVVVDYNCVFASSWMLAAISADRLWSIKWSIHYRNHNTKKKAAVIVIVVWLLVFAIAMYPTISDRILRTKDYYCHFVPAENPDFIIALSLLGHHIPCAVIIVCYIIVFIEIRKLLKTRPGDKPVARSKAKIARNTVSVSPTTTVNATTVTVADATAGTSRDPDVDHDGPRTAECSADDKPHNAASATTASENDKKMEAKKNTDEAHGQKLQVRQRHAAAGALTSTQVADAKARADRERKRFVTLSYIVLGYVVCWVPFHFVYDVSFIRPELVPDDLFTATFWLTYVNSTINPFLYAFSSSDLRKAVVKMLKCRCSHN